MNKDNIAQFPRAHDRRLRDLFDKLTEDAARGDLVGTIVIGIYRRRPNGSERPPALHMTGLASERPVLAVGIMATCEVLVKELALEKAGLI